MHQVGEQTAPAAFSSHFFLIRVFRKFFGKAANILPQIKHERPQRSYVAECIVSEKKGVDHAVAVEGLEVCLSGGRLLENQAQAGGFLAQK